MLVLILLLLLPLPRVTPEVDCWKACVQCRENYGSPDILEALCSMCDECKSRREERQQMRERALRTPIQEGYVHITTAKHDRYEDYPAECPTPPICSDSEAEYETRPTKIPKTTTSPKPTCPPITSCRKRKQQTSPACSPCKSAPCQPPCMSCPCPPPMPYPFPFPFPNQYPYPNPYQPMFLPPFLPPHPNNASSQTPSVPNST